jgi:glycosyltransferase involved in cell wall biosynthesis
VPASPTDTRKLRVVTLTHSLVPYGGAEQIAKLIMMRLDPARFDRTLCVTRPPRDRHADDIEATLAELDSAGVRVVVLNRPFRFAFWSWWPLVKLLRRERVEILHAHQFGSNAWGTIIGRLARVPVVIAHEHSGSFDQEALRRFVHREVIARGSDIFLAVSRNSRDRMIEVEGIDPRDVLFVPLGIPDPSRTASHDVRSELGIAPGQPVVGTVGVMRPEKALDLLVRSAVSLAPQFPGLRILIVGDGAERPRLEKLIDELGVRETVSVVGFRRDIPDVLAALDVAVCCSDFEGSPLSVMEYMEAGKPIVATRVGGVPDIIDDGVHGLLVPPQDPAALATAIGALLRDPERAAEMGRQAQTRRRGDFHIDNLVRRMENLYEELYASKRPDRALNGSTQPG